jgi:DNA polymerase-4
MDAFFASVEQACDPRLRGQPILVCGSQSRTVALSPSYEARAYGVKTGMTLLEAKHLCPGILCVPADNAKYTDTCCRIVAILQNYTPFVEVTSVDEAFLDLTGSLKLFGKPEVIAQSMKKQIRDQLGLPCSIGIAPNKLLAKLGSRLRKPDGLVVIRPEDISTLLERLPVKELCGIGPGTETALATLGIRTCGELGRISVELLRTRFGVLGERLHRMGLGLDDNPVLSIDAQLEAKGVSHSMTLPRDVRDREVLSCCLLQLSERVGRRMRREGYLGRTVSITFRYSDFTTFSRQHQCARFLDDGFGIFKAALGIFDALPLKQAVRLVGVTVSGLIKGLHQIPLFPEDRRQRAVLDAMDRVNDRYGEFCITWGTLLKRYRHKEVISPAWKPKGIKRY